MPLAEKFPELLQESPQPGHTNYSCRLKQEQEKYIRCGVQQLTGHTELGLPMA